MKMTTDEILRAVGEITRAVADVQVGFDTLIKEIEAGETQKALLSAKSGKVAIDEIYLNLELLLKKRI